MLLPYVVVHKHQILQKVTLYNNYPLLFKCTYPFLPILATPTVALPPRALSPNPPSHSYSASVYDLPECRALL